MNIGTIETVNASCPKHGNYQAKRLAPDIEGMEHIVSKCPKCKEIDGAERLKSEREQDEAKRKLELQKLIETAEIPTHYARATIDSYKVDPSNKGQEFAVKVCRQFVDNFVRDGRSMILTGAPGTGKTHLAIAMLLELMQKHSITATFVSAAKMLRSIKSTYHPNSQKTEQQVIDYYAKRDLLVLDEVGVQVGSDHEKYLMFEIFNERRQSDKSTIVISNMTQNELQVFMGVTAMERFKGNGAVLAFDWASARGVKL